MSGLLNVREFRLILGVDPLSKYYDRFISQEYFKSVINGHECTVPLRHSLC